MKAGRQSRLLLDGGPEQKGAFADGGNFVILL